MPILIGILRLPNIICSLKLTKIDLKLIRLRQTNDQKERMAPQASGYASRAILSSLPQLLVLRSHLQCHLPASLLDHVHLLLTLSSPVRLSH